MSQNSSTRADILRRVLRHINEGSYEDSGTQIWFGEGLGGDCPDDPEDELAAFWNEFRRELSDYSGRLASNERTNLGPPPAMSKRLGAIVDALAAVCQKSSGFKNPPVPATSDLESKSIDDTDALDRHYAAEVIEKLESIIRRAAPLGKVSSGVLPNRRVQIAFQEAHRCYLYGFHPACAVFCRAILEAGLKEAVNPDKDTTRSVFAMIEAAEERGMLTDDRPLCAREVDKAGNLAIHEPDTFDRKYSPEKVEDIILNTRKVLEELYRLPS